MVDSSPPLDAIYFPSPAAFRRWLEEHHASETELWVGFYRKATGRPSMTWSEAVDQAICFGWIDGVRRSVDAERYVNRYTPRRRNSNWSAINLKKVKALTEQGLMHPAGLAVFEARDIERSERYSFERKTVDFDEAQLREFRKHPEAWAFFESQPPSYRRTATWWVISAKREATRARRLATLIADSAAGLRIAMLRR